MHSYSFTSSCNPPQGRCNSPQGPSPTCLHHPQHAHLCTHLQTSSAKLPPLNPKVYDSAAADAVTRRAASEWSPAKPGSARTSFEARQRTGTDQGSSDCDGRVSGSGAGVLGPDGKGVSGGGDGRPSQGKQKLEPLSQQQAKKVLFDQDVGPAAGPGAKKPPLPRISENQVAVGGEAKAKSGKGGDEVSGWVWMKQGYRAVAGWLMTMIVVCHDGP